MMELNDKIARLEMRIEQVVIHLRSVPSGSGEAETTRAWLLRMLHQLRSYKERREQLEAMNADIAA